MADEPHLREAVDDSVPDDVTLFESDDIIYGHDDHGDFKLKPMTGAAEPQEGRCGAVVKYTMERYGQTRYCTAMPEGTFVEGGSNFCKRHKSHEALMERAHELFKHGHFAANYVNFVDKLSPVKFLFAVEMMGGLLEMSEHDFDVQHQTRTIDTDNTNLIEEDAVDVELPIPSNSSLSLQANELWHATLAEIEMDNMREVVFEDNHQRQSTVATSDMEGTITDTLTEADEHHLHLPLSRLGNEIQKHLDNGGVRLDDDDGGVVTFEQNDYTLEVSPAEVDENDADGGTDASADFAQFLEEDEESEISVESVETDTTDSPSTEGEEVEAE